MHRTWGRRGAAARAGSAGRAAARAGRAVVIVAALAAGAVEAQEAPRALARLDDYVGAWRSDEKTSTEGATYHFEYDLRWLDDDRTVTLMQIRQVGPEGETTLFEGFKGVEPSGSAVYYVAHSPSGRSARGSVYLDGDDLVTEYDGWGADGSQVRIRDVFRPVQGGRSFASTTLLRPAPDQPWRQIGEDVWTRRAG